MTVPPGPILSDALITSAIMAGEEGGAPASSEGLFDPSNDPELALVCTCHRKLLSSSNRMKITTVVL